MQQHNKITELIGFTLLCLFMVAVGIFIIGLGVHRIRIINDDSRNLFEMSHWNCLEGYHIVENIDTRMGYVEVQSSRNFNTRVYLIPQIQKDENGKEEIARLIGVQLEFYEFNMMKKVSIFGDTLKKNSFALDGYALEMPENVRNEFLQMLVENYGMQPKEAEELLEPEIIVQSSKISEKLIILLGAVIIITGIGIEIFTIKLAKEDKL